MDASEPERRSRWVLYLDIAQKIVGVLAGGFALVIGLVTFVFDDPLELRSNPPSVTISSPEPDASVGPTIDVAGSVANADNPTRDLWVFVRASGTGLFYPADPRGRTEIENGTWQIDDAQVGDRTTDVEAYFDVVAVLTSLQGTNAIEQELGESTSPDEYFIRKLPSDVEFATHVRIIRPASDS